MAPLVTAHYRSGRPKTITDGAGTKTLTYDLASGGVTGETYTGGLLNGVSAWSQWLSASPAFEGACHASKLNPCRDQRLEPETQSVYQSLKL